MPATQTAARFDYLTIGIEVDTGIIIDTGAIDKNALTSDGLSKLEKQLFAVGAETVKFDRREYKRVRDEVMLGSSSGKPIRIFTYELKR